MGEILFEYAYFFTSYLIMADPGLMEYTGRYLLGGSPESGRDH